jgi:hypothetical protein
VRGHHPTPAGVLAFLGDGERVKAMRRRRDQQQDEADFTGMPTGLPRGASPAQQAEAAACAVGVASLKVGMPLSVWNCSQAMPLRVGQPILVAARIAAGGLAHVEQRHVGRLGLRLECDQFFLRCPFGCPDDRRRACRLAWKWRS